MKSSLSRSTYILLTAESSIYTYTLLKLPNTQREKLLSMFGHTIRKHSNQKGSYFFHFLKIHDQLVDGDAFENDLVPQNCRY